MVYGRVHVGFQYLFTNGTKWLNQLNILCLKEAYMISENYVANFWASSSNKKQMSTVNMGTYNHDCTSIRSYMSSWWVSCNIAPNVMAKHGTYHL